MPISKEKANGVDVTTGAEGAPVALAAAVAAARVLADLEAPDPAALALAATTVDRALAVLADPAPAGPVDRARVATTADRAATTVAPVAPAEIEAPAAMIADRAVTIGATTAITNRHRPRRPM